MSNKHKITKIKYCKHCEATRVLRLVRLINSAGISMVYWCCNNCDQNPFNGSCFIAHQKLRDYGVDIEEIEIHQDYAGNSSCRKCGCPYAELHHWGPKHLFGIEEAQQWPKDYLCKKCHEEWHKIVTPNMTRKNQ